MSQKFILDSSVALSWFLEDEEAQDSSALDNLAHQHTAVVPSLWFYEITNALVAAEKIARLPSWEFARILKELLELSIEIDPMPGADTLTSIALIAKQFSLSAYDAAYLELAVRHRLPLATRDRKLSRAAERAAVTVIG